MAVKEPDYAKKSHVYIRRIVIDNDSVVWGGFDEGDRLGVTLPFKELSFNSGIRDIKVYFSSDLFSVLGATEYRYRLDAGGYGTRPVRAYDGIVEIAFNRALSCLCTLV